MNLVLWLYHCESARDVAITTQRDGNHNDPLFGDGVEFPGHKRHLC